MIPSKTLAITVMTTSILLTAVASADDPIVPGFTVEVYAEVTDPVRFSFDPDGVLYVGRDNDGSGGGYWEAVRIHRIGFGGLPVSEYGDTAIPDPDAVVFDSTGAISGVPGSVLVCGASNGPSSIGRISAIGPDESVSVVLESDLLQNPGYMSFDLNGRLLVAPFSPLGVSWINPNGVVEQLFSLASEVRGLAVDGGNRIATSEVSGEIWLHNSDGTTVPGPLVALNGSVRIAYARGGAFGTDLYALEQATGILYRIDTDGTATPIGSGFSTVYGLAFGPDGALYVSEFANDRILRIAPECPSLSILCPCHCDPADVTSDSGMLCAPFIEGTGNWATVPNGGFETGDTVYWYNVSPGLGVFRASTTAVANGTFAAQCDTLVEFSGSGYALEQTIQVQGGQQYILSCYFHAGELTFGKFYLDLRDVSFEQEVAAPIGCDRWIFAWKTITVPVGVSSVTVRVVRDGIAGNQEPVLMGEYGYVDQVAFTPMNVFVPPTIDRISHPISSSGQGYIFAGSEFYALHGTLPEQIATLNAGPPPFDPDTWFPVERKNENGATDGFSCSCEGVSDPQCESEWLSDDPLSEPFVSALDYIEDADEVTYDNCSSAFYRFTFNLPPNYTNPTLEGIANVDDQAVVFLNGLQISGTMYIPGYKYCDPGPCVECNVGHGDPDCVACEPDLALGPYDSCYARQDLHKDDPVEDAQGRRILTWPESDPFGTSECTFFVTGENELVFAVAGDASFFEPTGVEFEATVSYDLLGDGDSDGDLDLEDFADFQRCFTGASGGPLGACCSRHDFDGDGDVDLDDHEEFVKPDVFTGPR